MNPLASRMFARASTCCVVVVAIAYCVATSFHQPALGQSATQTTTAAKPAAPSHPGDVHLDSSRIYVFVDKTGFGHQHAVMGKLASGNLRLDGSGAGQLVFDMTSFDADSDHARKYLGLSGSTDASTRQQVNANMLGADVLNVKRYPEARFDLQSAKSLDKPSRRGLPQYELQGDFTLHGVKRSIRFTADGEEQNGWLHLRGGFSILQSHYGITPFSKAFGAVGVADQLQIWGDLWVLPAAAR